MLVMVVYSLAIVLHLHLAILIQIWIAVAAQAPLLLGPLSLLLSIHLELFVVRSRVNGVLIWVRLSLNIPTGTLAFVLGA